jgi:dTDP-4-dehydrorhamnose 3,5-epimerase
MKAIVTDVQDVVILEPSVFKDERGWFMETYNERSYVELGINVDFVQDNQSYSADAGILRGLHFQNEPMAQSKLVRCTRGRILDVAVDLRVGSPTYLKHVAVELNQDNKKQLFIPKGLPMGF